MRPLTAARIAATLGNAVTGLPAKVFGIPVILSANSPQQNHAHRAAHILYSDDKGFDISTSESAGHRNGLRTHRPSDGSNGDGQFVPTEFIRHQGSPVALVPPRADRRGRVHDGGRLMATKRTPQPDAGLQQIADLERDIIAVREQTWRFTYRPLHGPPLVQVRSHGSSRRAA
jgi:hypothetical protein